MLRVSRVSNRQPNRPRNRGRRYGDHFAVSRVQQREWVVFPRLGQLRCPRGVNAMCFIYRNTCSGNSESLPGHGLETSTLTPK